MQKPEIMKVKLGLKYPMYNQQRKRSENFVYLGELFQCGKMRVKARKVT